MQLHPLPELFNTGPRRAAQRGAFAVGADVHLQLPPAFELAQIAPLHVGRREAGWQKGHAVAGERHAAQTFGHVGVEDAFDVG
ncbi:hypothetical protein D9M69_623820 [compost metagenome]